MTLDLPEASNCDEVDHIVIYSSVRSATGNSTYNEVRKVCGYEIPDSILTYSSNALVRFITKSSNNLYSGFRFKFQSSIDTCGARLTASTGIIKSPGYPVSQDSTKYCEWLITVPKGRRVKVEVLDFDIKPSHNAASNSYVYNTDQTRIVFYNDFALVSHIASLVSDTDTSKPFYSSDNTMGISALIRRSNVGYRGFKLRFTSDEPTICEGNLNDNEGSFRSPDNVTRFACEFGRDNHRPFFDSQPNFGTLSIKIIEEPMPNVTTCISNMPTGISVGFVTNERRTFYSKCPPKYDNIASPYSSTKLNLRSTIFYKYRFPYKIHNCGGILTEQMTSITVPNTLPANYGEIDCAWQYTSNTDRNIQMILNAPPMNCDNEYLNIYRGRTPNRPRIARICGESSITNRTIVINGASTYIEYHTDSYNPNSLFSIQMVTSDGMCGGILDSPNYVFSSPKNGTKYPANTECEWIIRAQSGYHIGLNFANRFMLETSSSCTKDYVKVFDKVDGQFRELGRFCGRNKPPTLNSTGQEMKLVFHTDGDGDGDGFTAIWGENCGGVFTVSNELQYITSPRFPEPYPKNAYCKYSIVGGDGESISINFLKFDLEASGVLCAFDNVTIFKHMAYTLNQMQEVGTYCVDGSLTSFRYPKRVDVVFKTDSYIERSGFKFSYSTDKCGGNVTESTRIGSLDDNAGGYLHSASCVWFITAPVGKKIVIRFEKFDVEHVSGCSLDYVDVFEGHRTDDRQRKARLCGNLTNHAPSIYIDSNAAIVKFTTDATVNGEGFTALVVFTKSCNEHITLTSFSPRQILNKLTDRYEADLNCEYFVKAPVGYLIQVKFNQIHLAPCTTTAVNNSCTCDYLIIRDGAGPFAESFGSFCGDTNPRDLVSSGGDLYMRFVTDNIGFGTGFSVELEMIESPCGPSTHNLNETFSSITIESPMNGNLYRPNINCLWKFSTDDDKIIEILFEKFDLEEDPQNKCTNDFLEIDDEVI